jgi:hypothetical protein
VYRSVEMTLRGVGGVKITCSTCEGQYSRNKFVRHATYVALAYPPFHRPMIQELGLGQCLHLPMEQVAHTLVT